jgi:primosomal protein N' (replication factor Y) (superfamily II helicase)
MILQIALDTPLRRVFDYLPPAQRPLVHELPRPGVRVSVPFGRQRLIGILVGIVAESTLPLAKLKAAHEFLDERPVFDPVTFELLRWAADYYHHPIGEVYAAALPVSLRLGQPAAITTEQYSLTQQGRDELSEPSSKRAPQQRTLLSWLADHAQATADEVSETFNPKLLKNLAARGWIEARLSEVPGLTPMQMHPGELALTGAQAQAVDTILAALSSFNAHLLYGVTGSGKTEVYLRVIAAAIADGGQALVLVPEIALTPQLVDRFRRRFSAGVAVVHSGLSDSERRDAWREAHGGRARIVIGTRSAVFT